MKEPNQLFVSAGDTLQMHIYSDTYHLAKED